jgi:hypothetical protein
MASSSSIIAPIEALAKVEKPKGRKVSFHGDPLEAEPQIKGKNTLEKSILNILNGPKDSINRLAFETDPNLINTYQSVYKAKQRLIPDYILKRIIIQDDLVSAIVRARETHVSSFGRPRVDRHEPGFVIETNPGVIDRYNKTQKQELAERIQRAVTLFSTCGSTEGVKTKDMLSFSDYLMLTTRNAVGLGRTATEIIYTTDPQTKEKTFHSFRPTDAGTIFKATPQKSAEDAVRAQALNILQRMKNEKLIPERYQKDEYEWIQVIDSQAIQAFTDQEMIVRNFYPVLDVELDGYPVTPIDTMISAVTTHINITSHNKIYFQTGRAARGMLVFKSDDIDETTISRVKQEFNARINSVNNAWRMPVFGVSTTDEVTWQPIDNGSRDAEFQYLTDQNARIILSAFQMSPDELPGWGYLSRGTNNQALSESNNEYRLEAGRDIGIRPLLAQFEDFINSHLLPLIDKKLSTLCRLKLKGLDAETEEKETVGLIQVMPVHMTTDQVLEKVEKKPIGKEFGGEFLLNPQWQAIIDKYIPVGQIVEKFFGVEGASKDPNLQYLRDPFWFQFQQLQQAQQQMQQQAQAQQQQAAAGGPPGGGEGGGDDGGGEGGGDDKAPAGGEEGDAPGQQEQTPTDASEQPTEAGAPPQQPDQGQDLTRSIDQAIGLLTKSESSLPRSKQKLLAQHRQTLQHFQRGLADETRLATKEILAVVEQHKKR